MHKGEKNNKCFHAQHSSAEHRIPAHRSCVLYWVTVCVEFQCSPCFGVGFVRVQKQKLTKNNTCMQFHYDKLCVNDAL